MCIKTGSDVSAAQGLLHLRQQLLASVKKRLRCIATSGLTHRKLALTLCIGISLGIMPLIWGTTLICIVLAHVFRLNHVALQSVNYLLYPLQIALLLPFFKLGAYLFPWGPPVPPNLFPSLIRHPELSSLHILSWIIVKSLAAWLLTVLPSAPLVYGAVWTVTVKKSTGSENIK